MPFQLTKVDEDALRAVDIQIAGTESRSVAVADSVNGASAAGIRLNSDTLQFPPIITKDSKSAEWMEVPSGSFEPMKFYVQSKSRSIGLDFEWVCGGRFPPNRVHTLVSAMKSYFYGPYFASSKDKQEYPTVNIINLYGIITFKTTWRMMDLSVKYSNEMCKVDNTFYPLHVKVSINLESATQLAPSEEEGESETPFQNFTNLNRSADFRWY